MNRLDAMLDRLPPPLAIDRGSAIQALLAVVDVALAADEEDLDRIQRSRWLGFAFDRDDVAGLGALFGVAPADWEPLEMFRSRVQAEIRALLSGCVTVAELDRVVGRIVEGARQALGIRIPGDPVVVEFPDAVRRSPDLVSRRGLLRAHDTVTVVNRGLDPVPLQAAVIGVEGRATAMPVIVNRTTGRAVGWRGVVAAGKVLRIGTSGNSGIDGDPGVAVAHLDGDDVSDRVWSTAAFGPDVTEESPPQPLQLVRGDNVVAVETLGRYDLPGLDHAAYGVAGNLVQGRFGGADDSGSPFDDAVFVSGPVAGVDLWWTERQPAVFEVVVPWGAVARVARRRVDPEADRAHVLELLATVVDRLRAAAVVGIVRDRRLQDGQPALDRVAVLSPVATTESASAGQDRLAATSGLFDVTPRDQARYE